MFHSQTNRPRWQRRFVSTVYATHNTSPDIETGLQKCLARLQADDMGLNVGAGFTELHPAVINLDIAATPTLDCCAQAENLPFPTDSFAVIISQETLEHVRDPYAALREMHRVLQPGGTLYCQLPFTIGYHPGPTDFWRFTKEGIRELVEQCGFECEEVCIGVGPGTGFYRIAVEFGAVLTSRFFPSLYHAFKGVMALGLYPLKWLDPLLLGSAQADRIAGGYYVIASKQSK